MRMRRPNRWFRNTHYHSCECGCASRPWGGMCVHCGHMYSARQRKGWWVDEKRHLYRCVSFRTYSFLGRMQGPPFLNAEEFACYQEDLHKGLEAYCIAHGIDQEDDPQK